MTPEQLDGITKARIADSIALVQSGAQPHADDAAYVAHVCASAGLTELPGYAADSYAAQYSSKAILQLEQELADVIIKAGDKPDAPDLPAPTVAGIPQRVPRRQAKTIMELTPHPTHGDLWQAALAAANAIPDRAARIVTVNYLLESLYFEHPTVLTMAQSLLGMTPAQVDALFVAADKL